MGVKSKEGEGIHFCGTEKIGETCGSRRDRILAFATCREEPDPTGGHWTLHPSPRGAILRISVIPPDSREVLGLDPAKVRGVPV